MVIRLPVGLGSEGVEIADARVAGPAGEAAPQQAIDTARAVADALASPVGFPPLGACLTEEDRIAVAVGPGVPDLEAVLRGVLGSIADATHGTAHVDLVTLTPEDALVATAAAQGCGLTVEVVQHRPDSEEPACFAGMTHGGEAVLLNRTLFGADFVLPVLSALPGPGRASAFAGLFPDFSDVQSQRHCESLTPEALTNAQDEAGWLIGVPLLLHLVAGLGGRPAAAVAGSPDHVAPLAAQTAERVWRRDIATRSKLVVATVTGDHREPTWHNVARAVVMASRARAPGGAIAVCADVTQPIGRSLGRLIDAEDLSVVARRARKDDGWDSWAAAELAEALTRGPVFLFSRRDPVEVESMGLAPVQNTAELGRLAQRMGECLVIEDAHRASVHLAPRTLRPRVGREPR